MADPAAGSATPSVRQTVGGTRRRWFFGTGLLLIALTATGCSEQTKSEWSRGGLPEGATEQSASIQNLWIGSWIAALAVGALVWGLILWAVIAFRRRHSDGLPKQVKYNVPIEVLYTVAPLIMVIGLFVPVAKDQANLTELTNTYTNSVNVVGFRWSWGFNYLDEQVYDVGVAGSKPVLWMPINERTRFKLTSPDVIHSFWVPNFLFKMDVIPGRLNQFEITPNRAGTFFGECAELCGVDHSRMLFNVKVVTRAEYDAHIAELRANGQTGLLKTGRVSVKSNVRSGEIG
jgi:cytochrome c oxidase subunit 2